MDRSTLNLVEKNVLDIVGKDWERKSQHIPEIRFFWRHRQLEAPRPAIGMDHGQGPLRISFGVELICGLSGYCHVDSARIISAAFSAIITVGA